MPPVQYEVLDARAHALRHIGTAADLYPQGGAPASTTVLGAALVPRNLPTSHIAGSPDLAQGSYTGRLGDAGEFTLTFPNEAASDGINWRDRFDPDGHRQFIEITRNDELEFVGVILKVEVDRTQVVVSGQDGWFLLKKAYERDFTTVMAPRDVIERYGRVPRVLVADDFVGNVLDPSVWTSSTSNATVSVANGNLVLALTTGAGTATVQTIATVTDGTSPWRLVAKIRVTAQSGTSWGLSVGTTANKFTVSPASFSLVRNGPPTVNAALPTGAGLGQDYTLTLESPDGRWLRGFVNGQLVGYLPLDPTTGVTQIFLQLFGSGSTATVTVDLATLRQNNPFLLRGTDKGDYVLPGTAATYPTGGLHGRYYNDLDLAGDANRLIKVLNPGRTAYTDKLDPFDDRAGDKETIPQPGAATDHVSSRSFGAIFLKLSAGDYGLLVNPTGAVRVWIGKTNFGDQLIDSWTLGVWRNLTATISAAALGGKDGWYPIIIEHYYDVDPDANGDKLGLYFTPPVSYTDPGGTALTSAAQVHVPRTSLSPLGCYDQRVQGQSHFDLVQQVAQTFGHQVTCEAMQLESGEFPGRLAPRLRAGRDTDVILTPDDTSANEGILNYKNTLDSTDQATSLQGQGAGQADGQGGQITTEVIDVPSMQAGLFDLEGWVDSSDIAFPALLAARINSELGLRLAPWQNVEGDPKGFNRLADTFPLTGALAAMRWRPGDGVRLLLPDVAVEDASPRQMLQVTRQFGPEGRFSTQAGFRQRPRDPVQVQRKLVSAALRPQRSNQKAKLTLSAEYRNVSIAAATTDAGASSVALLPQDQVLSALVRVIFNSAGQTFDLAINTTLRGASLGGPWGGGVPVEVNILPFAAPVSTTDMRTFVQLRNTGGVTCIFQYQLIVTVLR
jgi:hypothetical protein